MIYKNQIYLLKFFQKIKEINVKNVSQKKDTKFDLTNLQ